MTIWFEERIVKKGNCWQSSRKCFVLSSDMSQTVTYWHMVLFTCFRLGQIYHSRSFSDKKSFLETSCICNATCVCREVILSLIFILVRFVVGVKFFCPSLLFIGQFERKLSSSMTDFDPRGHEKIRRIKLDHSLKIDG